MALIDTLESWIADFPPLESPQRFGNRAFADWLGKLEAEAPRLMVNFLPEHLESSSSAAEELSVYFALGFGNGTRIDYGSGHELAFVAWLACLRILGVLKESDMKDIVLCIFNRYLRLIRKLQETYRLEPAGSHGVWGLDDFQFLSYYWGRYVTDIDCSTDFRSHDTLIYAAHNFLVNTITKIATKLCCISNYENRPSKDPAKVYYARRHCRILCKRVYVPRLYQAHSRGISLQMQIAIPYVHILKPYAKRLKKGRFLNTLRFYMTSLGFQPGQK